MPVTELARLSLQPGTEVSSPRLLSNLAKAKDVMEEASGFKFRYYHCVEEPSVVFILGAWPSVDFHMQEFIPGQANQELLALLKDQITVEAMFHLDLDQSVRSLPLSKDMIAVVRHFITEGEKDSFMATFENNKHELESFIGSEDHVVGGWRVDKGYDPSVEGEKRTEEFVLFTAWDSVEHHFEFAKTEGFQRYSKIRNHVDGADIKHAKELVDLGDQGQK